MWCGRSRRITRATRPSAIDKQARDLIEHEA
jgi:hypothetical protein